jgi:Ca2+-transporting ATPase
MSVLHHALGLSTEEAAARLASDGYNELPAPERRGDRTEALLLLAFATLSVLITVVQESRNEGVPEALRNLASPRALVVRDGKRVHIAGRVGSRTGCDESR